MIETVAILVVFTSLVGFGGYRYCETVRSELRAQYDVIYYMLSDFQRERLNKNKSK
jgi:hypothetical protein